MATQVLEGTWEEITKHAKSLVGRKVRVTILDDEPAARPKPNVKALAVIRKVAERQKKYARNRRRKQCRYYPARTSRRNIRR